MISSYCIIFKSATSSSTRHYHQTPSHPSRTKKIHRLAHKIPSLSSQNRSSASKMASSSNFPSWATGFLSISLRFVFASIEDTVRRAARQSSMLPRRSVTVSASWLNTLSDGMEAGRTAARFVYTRRTGLKLLPYWARHDSK